MKTLWSVLFVPVWLGFSAAAASLTPGSSSDNFCIHDVKVEAIVAPRGTVDSGVVLTPRAIVRNVGDFAEVFPVTMQVANGYNRTVQCTLQVGQTDTVEFFPAWVARPVGTFATVCFSSLGSDQNRRNDTVRASVEVVRTGPHDVGAVAILAPLGVFDSGVVVVPSAVIRNFGAHPETFPVSFSIGTSYYDSTNRSLMPGQSDTVEFRPWIAQPVGRHEPRCCTRLEGDQNRQNDTVVAEDSVEVVACWHDVGAIAILAPVDTVDSGALITPRAVIRNFGDRQDTFPVTFQIGAGYSRTVVRVLAPSRTDTVEFDDWHAGPVGRLTTVCFTSLTRDQNRSNDTIRSHVDVVPPVRHDVAVVAILDPVGSIDSGTQVVPRAVVQNMGDAAEVFPVTFDIGASYSETVQTELGIGQTDTVEFPLWVAQPVGTVALTCYSNLTADDDRSNDTARSQVEVVACRHDVGVLAILTPPDTVDSGSVHAPSAVIHNFGDRRETFPVSFRIGADYAETVQRTLAPGATDTVRFPDWVARTVGPSAMLCFTGLDNDIDRSNDTAYATVHVATPKHPDVGTVSIVWPFGLIDSGSVGVPRALIANYGDEDELFQVTFRIGAAYRDSIVTRLAAGETTEVSFSLWVAQPVGHHEVLCYTQLAADQDRSNDTARTELCVVPRTPPRRDVGAIEIVTPTGSVVLGTVVVPRARVGNFGDSTEVFPVTFEIEPDYSTTVICTLASARTTIVDFPTWIAGPLGQHGMTCYTSLDQDADRSNDTVRNSVLVVEPDRRDVAVLEIIAPADTVDSGSVHTPSAKVTNLGNRAETFPVTFKIGSVYSHTLPSVTLNPGDTATLYFQSWTAVQPGSFATMCFTSLGPDENRSNDTAYATVAVRPPRYDVGAIAILAPADTVDSGTVITPVAVVHRFADEDLGTAPGLQRPNPDGSPLVTFPVTMAIGGAYRQTVQVTMPAQGIDTVRFDPTWIARPVGAVGCTCYTSLAGDPNRRNDTAYGMVVVMRPAPQPRHDVAVLAILAPADTVDSGSVHTPSAKVTNLGNRTETFPVTFKIGSVYSHTLPSVTLNPGDTTTLYFHSWTAVELGTFTTTCYSALGPDENRSNDTAYGSVVVVNRTAPPRHDVAVLAVLAPPDTVDSGTVCAPSARVANLGNRAEVFPVTFRMGTGYFHVLPAVTLLPGDTTVLYFEEWTAARAGTFPVVCYTELVLDEDRSNDTAYRTVTVVDTTTPARHDVAVLAIHAPADTVDSGSVHTPSAKVTNLGNRAEVFPVTFEIGGMYSRTLPAVNLNPGDTVTLFFPSWTAARTGSFTTTCYSALGPDEDRSNDTAYGSVVVVDTTIPARHDVGVLGIVAPTGTVDSGSVHTPSAWVTNWGTRTATFPVTFEIGSIYRQTLPAVTLNPGDTTIIYFPVWTASQTGSFATMCFSALAQDEDRSNDTAYSSVMVADTTTPARHDASAVAIVVPTGDVRQGASVVPVGVVRNLGTRRETFPVSMKIGNAYLATVMVESIPAGAFDTVRFPAWNASSAGVESVSCYTSLGLDENRANDTIAGLVRVVTADVGVVAIVAPSGQVDSGVLVTPRAVVRNFGPGAAVFPVTMVVGTSYVQSVQVELQPDASDTVEFPLWVAQPVGSISTTCYSSLAGDPNPANDTARGSVQVTGATHDIGADAVLSPVGRTTVSGPPWSVSVRPRCRIRNYSGSAESGFEVNCRIYERGSLNLLYDRTELVSVVLAPGGSFEVNFPDTVFGYGAYAVRCSTRLLTDKNPGNDRAEADYVVASQVGGPSQVVVKIYTRAGECVRRLERSVTEGSPPWILWDRKNDNGQRVAAGVYLCVVTREGATDQGGNGTSTANVLVSRDAEEVRVMWRQP